MNPIRIALVDDHTLFRGGIKKMLQNDPDFDIRIETGSGNELFEKMARQKVDVVVTDISMPEMNGEELTRIVCRDFKDVAVIALSMHDDIHYIKRMMAAGAKGYVLKTANPHELMASVKHVVEGSTYFCGGAMATLAKVLLKTDHQIINAFTEREKKVLRMIFEEYGDQEIADALQVNIKTVQADKKELFRKTDTKSVVGLTKWVTENGLQ